jgi:hypothetical protein
LVLVIFRELFLNLRRSLLVLMHIPYQTFFFQQNVLPFQLDYVKNVLPNSLGMILSNVYALFYTLLNHLDSCPNIYTIRL